MRDVASDQQNGGLETTLVIDRDTASRLGIRLQAIDDTLYDAFGQRLVSTMFTQLNQYHVVLEVAAGSSRQAPSDLDDIYVTSAGAAARFRSAHSRTIEQTHDAADRNHQGQFPVVTLSFNLRSRRIARARREGDSSGGAGIGLPPSIHAEFRARRRHSRLRSRTSRYLILAALVTVYIVLGVLYESYIHPITILSTLPSAGVGAMLALIICRDDFSVVALIGIMLLIGIVKKNAIMMIDFALEAERNEGKAPEEAIYQACLLRFRPIMMTTMAALFGGAAAGARQRRRLGAAAAAGHHDRRRLDPQPGADALHDAGYVSVI